ncbi:MAG: hypothetical protein CMH60_04280 [Myxococcales bacterium]|nr:hypothetical protein [Myxococcales bacterium]
MVDNDKPLRETLIAISQEMFPHQFLEKVFYGKAIDRFYEDLEESQKSQLRADVKNLDEQTEDSFLELSKKNRLDALMRNEHTEFFRNFHRSTLRYLYNDPDVWAFFGYEGPSARHGGYLKRGFDDASWIPEE